MNVDKTVGQSVNLPELAFVGFQIYHLTIEHYHLEDYMIEVESNQLSLKRLVIAIQYTVYYIL